MKRIAAALGVLLIVVGAERGVAQPWSTRLPTPQGGDYGNGAAVSDAAGGVFIPEAQAAAVPAVAFGIPTGYGADGRDVFAAAGLQRGLRFDPDFTDGAVFGGFGMGNARTALAAEVTVAAIDLVGETLKDATLGVKVHRRLGAVGAVAVGIENMLVMGTTDGGRSAYGVVSTRLPAGASGRTWWRHVTVTAGLGDGRFNAVERVRRGHNGLSAFGSVAVDVHAAGSVLATWTGQDLTVGVSVAPVPRWPIVLTPVLLDVTGQAGAAARFALSAGVGLTL